MRKIVILAGVLLAALPALPQSRPVTPSHTRAAPEVRRNIDLEQAVFDRADRLKSVLQPGARVKLDLAARGLIAHLASGSGKVDYNSLARREVRSRFGKLSRKQTDLLSFQVLAEVARILTVPDELNKELDGIAGMNEEDALRLQKMMDRRSKMMSTLSNMMKKISSTQDGLVQNLK